jgi:sulfatase maturation enzyme AslB (radical SAM superfamily)
VAQEWYELGLSKQKPKNNNWVDDPVLFEKFVDGLCSIKNLRYLHFIGGETVITPAFVKILEHLIQKGLHRDVILGFTTNLTVYNKSTISLLKQFKDVHVGLSIETMNDINDYIRWPSKIELVKEILNKWVRVSKENNWNVTIRPTPNVLSIGHIHQLYEYVLENNIGIESCNFMYRPTYLKVSVLPMELRKIAIEKIKKVIDISANTNEKIFNIRNPRTYREYVKQDALSLVNYLESEPYTASDNSNLVDFLKRIESKRKNNIIEYLPEYEEFFRSIGY